MPLPKNTYTRFEWPVNEHLNSWKADSILPTFCRGSGLGSSRGEDDTRTAEVCPSGTGITLTFGSQIRTVWSSDADANKRPDGQYATSLTAPVCPTNGKREAAAESSDHCEPSSDPQPQLLQIRFENGLLTGPLWPETYVQGRVEILQNASEPLSCSSRSCTCECCREPDVVLRRM